VIRKEAWPLYGTASGVSLCWELEQPEGHVLDTPSSSASSFTRGLSPEPARYTVTSQYWILEILYCNLNGRMALLRVPSTVGRSVCLCWEHSIPKGPKVPEALPRSPPLASPTSLTRSLSPNPPEGVANDNAAWPPPVFDHTPRYTPGVCAGRQPPSSRGPNGARPVHLIITMIKRIRTSRLTIKNSFSLSVVRRPASGVRRPVCLEDPWEETGKMRDRQDPGQLEADELGALVPEARRDLLCC